MTTHGRFNKYGHLCWNLLVNQQSWLVKEDQVGLRPNFIRWLRAHEGRHHDENKWYVELIFYFCPYFINVVVELNVLDVREKHGTILPMVRKRCGEGCWLICSGGKFHIKSLICIHMKFHVFNFILIVIVSSHWG